MTRNIGAMADAAKKRKRALEMREQGATYQQIADEIYPGKNGKPGSRANAHHAITKAIAEIPAEKAEDVRAIELLRLDKLWLVAYNKAMLTTTPAAERDKSMRMCLSIMERRAKLLGLDAPAQVHNMGDGVINISFDDGLLPSPMLEPAIEVPPVAD